MSQLASENFSDYFDDQRTSPFKNRFNSDRRILQPFPAFVALILPKRIYFRNVGFEIFRYCIASSVVSTISFSIKDIELPPFVLVLVERGANYMPKRPYENPHE